MRLRKFFIRRSKMCKKLVFIQSEVVTTKNHKNTTQVSCTDFLFCLVYFVIVLKGVWHEIFNFRLCSWISFSHWGHFCKKSKWPQLDIHSRVWNKLIHEKKQKTKISCQTPFKGTVRIEIKMQELLLSGCKYFISRSTQHFARFFRKVHVPDGFFLKPVKI